MSELKFISKTTINKFFDKLEKLNRLCSTYYPNKECQKTVFCRRVSNLLVKNWIILNEEGKFPFQVFNHDSKEPLKVKIRKNEILYFNGFSYNLGYSDELIIFGKLYKKSDLLKLQYKYLNTYEINAYLSLIQSNPQLIDCYGFNPDDYKIIKTKSKLKNILKKFDILDKLVIDHIWCFIKFKQDFCICVDKKTDRFKLGEVIYLEKEKIERDPLLNIINEEK